MQTLPPQQYTLTPPPRQFKHIAVYLPLLCRVGQHKGEQGGTSSWHLGMYEMCTFALWPEPSARGEADCLNSFKANHYPAFKSPNTTLFAPVKVLYVQYTCVYILPRSELLCRFCSLCSWYEFNSVEQVNQSFTSEQEVYLLTLEHHVTKEQKQVVGLFRKTIKEISPILPIRSV